MKITINLRSNTPIYMQIVEQIRQQALGGELNPGNQLPTVRALAADLGVNFNTVARAYRILDDAHIISTQQGRGTYYLNESPPDGTENLRTSALEAAIRRLFEETDRLGFNAKQVMERINQTLNV